MRRATRHLERARDTLIGGSPDAFREVLRPLESAAREMAGCERMLRRAEPGRPARAEVVQFRARLQHVRTLLEQAAAVYIPPVAEEPPQERHTLAEA